MNLGRPRGIVSAGIEEPSALVQLEAPYPEPMLTATTVELYDGLVATACPGGAGWPTARIRPATTRSTPTATCWWSAAARPAWPPPQAAAGAGRPRDPGRRTAHARRRPARHVVHCGAADAARRREGAHPHHGRRATTTTTTCSPWSAAPTPRPDRAGGDPATALAHPGRPGACSPPARTSGRSPSPTTTGPASCWPARPGPTCTATACLAGRRAVVFTTNDTALRGRRRPGGRPVSTIAAIVDARIGVRRSWRVHGDPQA